MNTPYLTYKPLKFFILFLLIVGLSIAWSQSNKKDELQKKYNKIQDEIKKIENMISSTKKERSASIEQLNVINSKINTRLNLIGNINDQIKYLDASILEKQQVINSLKKDIEKLKADYAQMIQNTYYNKYKTNPIAFIFNAGNFNQAFQRFAYIRSYANTRKNQSKLILKTIDDLNLKLSKLEEDKKAKQGYLNEEQSQRLSLENERSQKNELISKLQKDEESLKKQATQKNKDAQALNNQIQKIIEAEIAAAKAKAAKEAAAKGTKTTTSATTGMSLTPEEKALSKDFVNNMGKLPWPVSKGFIVERFGQHPHPTLDKVMVNNNGVDIKTEKEASVRALFNGTVVNSFYLPASQNSVIIKHGEYFTVYSNLKSVSVKAGESVSTKQIIGTVYTDENGIAKIHIEVWKGTEKTNPEYWLAK
ncbi:MAG: peptidoglycan DD-metalloendopeptidase family protein [Chitinophagales bacterium]|nr:peptidoglycan DD-metalloendopeptidase family protein [Chitinophagales bacterium]